MTAHVYIDPLGYTRCERCGSDTAIQLQAKTLVDDVEVGKPGAMVYCPNCARKKGEDQ